MADADAVVAGRFWVIPPSGMLDDAVRRWHSAAERNNPDPERMLSGLPPAGSW